MALMTCAECGKQASDRARRCPSCGAPVPRRKDWLWVMLLLAGGAAVLVMVEGSKPGSRERADARAAIEHCWEEQQRKSFSPEVQQAVAGTCEHMERQFVRRFGMKP